MEKVVLKAEKRDVIGKQVKALRRAGKLPAVIYGRHTEPINVSLDAHTASLVLGKLTSSSLVTIDLDGKEYPALVREKQRDYIKNRLLHVDFLAVSLTESLRASVAVNFVGVSAAVKDFNAVLVTNLQSLEVECLPTDLPERIDVDISALARPGDGIRVRDVEVSDKVRLLNDPDTMVAVATFAKVEEEVAAVPGAEGVAPDRGRARTGCGTWQEGRRGRRRVILSSAGLLRLSIANSPILVGEFFIVCRASLEAFWSEVGHPLRLQTTSRSNTHFSEGLARYTIPTPSKNPRSFAPLRPRAIRHHRDDRRSGSASFPAFRTASGSTGLPATRAGS